MTKGRSGVSIYVAAAIAWRRGRRVALLAGFGYLGAAGLRAQDTFSLVLFDPATGAFVSAGGSCIDGDAIEGGAAVISHVLPGVGVVHTQSYYHADNQALGARLLAGGLSAKPLLDSLLAGDVSLTPSFRQYIVYTSAPATDHGAGAAYTGEDSADWKGHLVGPGYVLAGNILLDSTVLRRMETALLDARERGGDVAAQGRAALRAAAFPGADRRCLEAGLSCRSAFFRLALPTDAPDDLTVDARVLYPDGDRDPILTLLEQVRNPAPPSGQ